MIRNLSALVCMFGVFVYDKIKLLYSRPTLIHYDQSKNIITAEEPIKAIN